MIEVEFQGVNELDLVVVKQHVGDAVGDWKSTTSLRTHQTALLDFDLQTKRIYILVFVQ